MSFLLCFSFFTLYIVIACLQNYPQMLLAHSNKTRSSTNNDGKTKFNICDGIQELALPTSSCSSEFLASREFRILSFCCFSRLPIPFPSATGRNCRNDMIQLVHKISLLRQTEKSKPLGYKNLSMFARMLWRFFARQLLIKLPTTCCC